MSSLSNDRRSTRLRTCSEPEIMHNFEPRLIPSRSVFNPGSLDGGSADSSISSSPAQSFASAIGGYLTGSVSRFIGYDNGGGSRMNHHGGSDERHHEFVLCVEIFRLDPSCGHELIYIVQGFRQGFQMWDVSSSIAREVLNIRKGEAVCSAAFFGNWSALCRHDCCAVIAENMQRSKLALATSPCSDTWPNNIRIFDLDLHKYIHTFSLGSAEIHGLVGNETCLVVSLSREVRIYSASNFQETFRLGCYPQPEGEAVLSLGKRWLAVPADNPPSDEFIDGSSKGCANGMPSNQNVVDIAQGLVGGLYYLKGVGKNRLDHAAEALSNSIKNRSASHILNPEVPEHVSLTIRANSARKNAAGSVALVDARQGSAILHFKSHREPLAKMAFNSAGNLLVTAIFSGQTLHVHAVRANSAFLVYRLIRGFTPATVRSLSFSPCDKWLALATSHGTTHIFGIDPDSGSFNLRDGEGVENPTDLEVKCRIHRPSIGSGSSDADYLSSSSFHKVIPSSWSPETGCYLNKSVKKRCSLFVTAFRSKCSSIVGVGDDKIAFETMLSQEEGSSSIQVGDQRYWKLLRGGCDVSAADADAALMKATMRGGNYSDALRARRLRQALMIQPTQSFEINEMYILQSDENSPKKIQSRDSFKKLEASDNWLNEVERETFCPVAVPMWANPLIKMAKFVSEESEAARFTSEKGYNVSNFLLMEELGTEAIKVRRQGPEALFTMGSDCFQSEIEQAINTHLMR